MAPVVVTLLVACSSRDHGSVTAVSTAGATSARGSFRIGGTVRVTDARDHSRLISTGTVEGEVDIVGKRTHSRSRSTASDTNRSSDGDDEDIRIGEDTWTRNLLPSDPQDPAKRFFGDTHWFHARSPLQGQDAFDPAGFLNTLSARGARLTRTGTDVVRGVKTTRFDVHDPSLAANNAAGGIRSVQVWVDDSQLLRRIRFVVEDKFENGPAEVIDATSDLFDFGAKFEIQPPPPSDVKEMTQGASPPSG